MAALLMVFGITGCQPEALPQAAAETAKPKAPVVLACEAVRLRTWPQTVRVQGSLLGDEHAVIGTKVAGRVRDVQFDLGMPVQQGAVLASLDREDFELKVQQAQAQVDQSCAKLGLLPDQSEQNLNPLAVPSVMQEKALLDEGRANLKRGEALSGQNVISAEDLQQRRALAEVAEARYHAALDNVNEQRALLQMRRAELALARQNLDDAAISAPFAGTVQERHVAPGVYLNVGQRVATLVRVDPLRYRAGVPEREAMQVALGQEVRVFIAGETKPRIAKVSRISPALDVSSRSLTIEADLANPGTRLPIGLFAEGEIIVAADAQVLAVPAQAVWEFAGVEKVWRVVNGEATEQQVTTRRRNGTLTEIVDGLTAGDVVIADARQGRPGPVQPANQQAKSK